VPRRCLLLLATLAALPACKDTPSYRLRWEIVGRYDTTTDSIEFDAQGQPLPLPEQDPPTFLVTKAHHCSQHGITAIRVRAIDPLGAVASEDVHPCFPEGFADVDVDVAGPELPAGEYALEVRGVQRDLQPWVDATLADAEAMREPDEQDEVRCVPGSDTCSEEDLVCACDVFTAVEDETFADFDSFRLVAPPECIDGIDNDADGSVDGKDGGCADQPRQEMAAGDCGDGTDNDGDGRVDLEDADCFPFEASDVAIVQFQLRTTLLGDNPNAACHGVGITTLRVEAVADATGDRFTLATLLCLLGGPQFFAGELMESGGSYTIEVTGIGLEGSAVTRPVVAPTSASDDTPLRITPGQGAVVDIAIDIGVDDFDPPLDAPAYFEVKLADLPAFADVCPAEETHDVTGGYALRVLDAAGAPVADATLDDGTPLDGTPQACISGKFLNTGDLAWGAYRLVGEARAADGTVCFASDPMGVPLAPNVENNLAAPLVLAPVLDDEAALAACFACVDDC
jgi:hypothetical protein